MKVRNYLGIALLVGLSVILFSCGGSEAEQPPPPAPEPEEQPQAIIQEEDLETIQVAEITHALITFITGDAYIIDDGDTDGGFFADIGGTLGPGQSLEVETGYAELQIGDIGTVRVQEASTVRLDDIVLSSQGSSVDIRVVSGSVLNKVERLAGTDSYEIRTETAVMGVRGTEFGVNVDPDGGTRVAVREGRVAMVPPAADPERVRQRAAGAGNAAAAVEAVAVSLAENAPVIEANQESRLDRADAAEAEVVAARMEETIVEIEERSQAGETMDVEEVAVRLTAAAEETTSAAQAKTEERRTELTEESREELEEIEEIRYIPLPPPPAEESGDTADAEAEDGEEAEAEPTPVAMPVLVPVRVQVLPEGASIAINGRRVGQNRFSGVYQPGDQVTFELSLDGYRTETLSVTVDPDRGRAYQVQLAAIPQRPEPEPEPVEATFGISTDPADAQIFIDGRRAGTGNVSESFEVGREIVVRAELEGYDTVEQTVSITEEIEPLSISLSRTIAGIRIETVPDDAVVTINGENRGEGSVTAEFPLGEEVTVSVSRDGYKTVERTVEVEGTAEAVRFELEQLIGTVSVSAQPADATILINGQRVGSGSVSREYPVGTELTLRIQRSTYAPLEIPVTVGEGINELEYQLSRNIGALAVTVVPNNARITINGQSAGTGSVTREFAIGETVQVSASRPGFAPVQRSVQVSDTRSSVELRLQPRPIEATISAASSPWIRGLVTDGTRVFGADGSGTVYAVDPAGRLLWQRATGNSGNENSVPVVSGGRVAFSGAAELVVMSATTGQVQGRRALSGAESHLFGRRVTPRSGGWFFPSDDAVLLLSADGRSEQRRFAIPGGSKMSAGVASNRILLADQQGGVVILDAASGNVITTVSTGMTQPVAVAPAIAGNTAVFVGRRGTVTAINVSGGTVLWESGLPGGRGSFVDPVIVGQRVLFLDRNELIALSLADGSRSYSLNGVAGTPAVDGTTIYVPYTDGTIRALDGTTGRTLRELSLPAGAAGGAVMVGERVATGLEDGRVVIIHPAGM